MGYADLLEQQMFSQQMQAPIRTIDTNNNSRDDELDDLLNASQVDITSINGNMSKTSVENKTESTNSYSFPILGDSDDKFETVNLAKIMSDLVESWEKHRDYMQIRDAYCNLSIAMNHEGLFAPAYRAYPTIHRHASRRPKDYHIIQKDRLVIECHWLCCRQESVVTRDQKYQPLFDVNQPFPFDLSEKFACENWSNKHRADDALYLTAQQQSQLFALQGDIVRERRVLAMDGIKEVKPRVPPKVKVVRLVLRKWGEKKSVIVAQYEAYEGLWLARELLDKDASRREIAKLGGLITGTSPLDESTVRLKLAGLDKRISGYGKV